MFSQSNKNKFQPLTIPLKTGAKLFVYFKRFNPETVSLADKPLYEIFQQKYAVQKPENSKTGNPDLPTKRTILCVNFDMNFVEEKVKKVFRILGKIRKVFLGSFEMKKKLNNEKTIKTVYFSFIVFHKEEDARKAFELEWFQNEINQKYRFSNLKSQSDDKEKYAYEVLSKYLPADSFENDEKKEDFLNKMQEDGFTMVLNKQGSVELNKKKVVEEKPKKTKYLQDFYKFQNKSQKFLEKGDFKEGMDPEVALKLKKRRLIEEFEKDKEKLKKIKL